MAAIKLSLAQAHNKNVDRYRKLLKTRLTDVERYYVEERLSEKLSALREITNRKPLVVVRASGSE